MTVTPLTPSTMNPCPSWCEMPAGHGYHSNTIDGQHSCRDHQLEVGMLNTAANCTISVDITADELTDLIPEDTTEPVSSPATVGKPHIFLAAEHETLTADEALSLSEMLARAARQLKSIQNGDQETHR